MNNSSHNNKNNEQGYSSRMLQFVAKSIETLGYLFVLILSVLFVPFTLVSGSEYFSRLNGYELFKDNGTNEKMDYEAIMARWEFYQGHHFTASLYWVFCTHLVSSAIYMASGILVQFNPWLRKRSINLHRWVGRVYMICNIFSALSAIALGFKTAWGTHVAVSSALFGVLSLFTMVMAYLKIKNKQLQAHREWIMRNYAIGFGTIVIRIVIAIAVNIELVRRRGDDLFAEHNYRPIVGGGFWLGWWLSVIVSEIYIILKYKLNGKKNEHEE